MLFSRALGSAFCATILMARGGGCGSLPSGITCKALRAVAHFAALAETSKGPSGERNPTFGRSECLPMQNEIHQD